MFNTITIYGRIGTMRDYKSGKNDRGNWSIQGFSVATFGGWKPGEDKGNQDAAKTLWFDCSARNHNADKVSQCKVGDLVVVAGHLEADEFTTKDGTEVTKPVLIVEKFFLAKESEAKPNPQTGRSYGNRTGYGNKR